jgi:hypothetical protein
LEEDEQSDHYRLAAEELIPQMSEGEQSDFCVILFSVGFSPMMTLAVMHG